MIKTDIISANALRITAPEKLKADDFAKLLRKSILSSVSMGAD